MPLGLKGQPKQKQSPPGTAASEVGEITEAMVARFRRNVLVSSQIRGGRLSGCEDHEIRAIIRAALKASTGEE